MSGYQFVWWPRPRNWHIGFSRVSDDLRVVASVRGLYRWFLCLGPLEVRRWRS